MPASGRMVSASAARSFFGRFKIHNSIFARLVVTFLVIMIPIYALGAYIYIWGLTTVENEISNSTVSQISFYLAGIDDEIDRIKMLQYDCLNDDALNKLAIRWETMTPYDRIENMISLHRRLQTIKNSSVYIQDARAHIKPIQRTISANTGMGVFNAEHFENIRVGEAVKGGQVIPYRDGYYLSTLQNGRLTSENPLYMIEIELSRDVFAQAIAQFNTYVGSSSVLVDIKTNAVIAHKGEGPNLMHLLDGTSASEFLRLDGNDYFLAQDHSSYLNWALQRYIPANIVRLPLQHVYSWIWIFTLTAIGLIVIYSFYTYRIMHKPLLLLVQSFQKVEEGDLNVSIPNDSKTEFGYMYERFNNMVSNLHTLIDQVYNQKLMTQRAELKQLQSQINPHFLYNSLFIINTMARTEDENLIPFTKLLGEYFRYITRSGADFIPLCDEVAHARNYANIQRMRFSKRLSVDFDDYPPAWANFKVPRLILQPIIENAFEHGIAGKTSDARIAVRFSAQGDSLYISVEDNGSISDEDIAALDSTIDSNTGGEITGLLNIHQRVRLVFGASGGVKAQRSDLGGLKVTLFMTREDEKCTDS